MQKRGFTLIELLVVIAIIAILSIVVVLTLNPTDLLRQSRDSNRVSDLASLTSALGIYGASGGTSFGSSSVLYVSLPDPAATSSAGDQCQGLGLPVLPSTYTYHCAASSTFRNIDSTGWIPVTLSSMVGGSPLGSLPVDPINQSSSRLYYTYVTNGTQFESTASMESSKYKLGGSNDVIGSDGAILSSVYAKGSNLSLEPLDYGDNSLVGYWPLTEGTGTVAYDYSGNNATGTLSCNGNCTPLPLWVSGQIGPYALNCSTGSDYINVSSWPAASQLTNAFTVMFWQNGPSDTNVSIWGTASPSGIYVWETSSGSNLQTQIWNSGTMVTSLNSGNGFLATSTWGQYAVTYNGNTMSYYRNGVLFSSSVIGSFTAGSMSNFKFAGQSNFVAPGLFDDVRVYNRALSASEIAGMYAGGK